MRVNEFSKQKGSNQGRVTFRMDGRSGPGYFSEYAHSNKKGTSFMVIKSKECEDKKDCILTCLNEEMLLEDIVFRDFLFSGDCLHRAGNGVTYMLQKEENWRMDRYRNLLYIINHEIGSYIRAEFNEMREVNRRVGLFGIWRFETRDAHDGTLSLGPVPFRGRLDSASQARKMRQILHVSTKVEEVGVAIVTGLRRTDPGLLVGLDIATVKAFILKAFWKEVRLSFDNSFTMEVFFDKRQSNLPCSYGLQCFYLTPHNLSHVKVELFSRSQLRLRGCENLSNMTFFKKG